MTARAFRKLLLFFGAVNALLLIWNSFLPSPPDELRVTVLDVGQGDAIVIQSPSGKVLLVDAGGILPDGDDQGRRVVAGFLRQCGVRRIDALLLTHTDADHIGGAPTLLERFPIGFLLDNGQNPRSSLLDHILTAAHHQGVPRKTARRGQTLDFGDGVTAQILAPAEAQTHGADNEASIVVRLSYGRIAFLLTGDAEANSEADMVRSGQPLAADVLKVGHHGSHTSSTPAFLTAVHPRLAVISVGAHNNYGHPAPDVVERLQNSGAQLYRTDRDGAVTCHSDGVTVRAVTTALSRQP